MEAVHELSLCGAIAGVVRPHAAGRHVDVVRVQVGALRQVVPESLEFCWSLIREYEEMPDAELELEFVAAEVGVEDDALGEFFVAEILPDDAARILPSDRQ